VHGSQGLEFPIVILSGLGGGVRANDGVQLLANPAERPLEARGGPALAALASAFVIQAVYLGFQIHLYAADLTRFSPRLDAYASIYFTLLAVHHIHVGVGLVLDGWLLARLSRGLTPYRRTALSAVALYWYFVSIAGLFVTATILSPSW